MRALVSQIWRELATYGRPDLRSFLNFLSISLRDRYLGSKLGLVWAVLSPLLLLSIFTFVFSFVLKARLPGSDSSLAYTTWLIAGYGPWLFLSDGLSAATSAFVKHGALIRNLKFRREMLVFAEAATGLIPLAVAIPFLVVLLATNGPLPNASWLALPLVLAIQFVFICGAGLVLASMNVFVRDIALSLPNLLMVMLFATPILYPLDAIPKVAQGVMVYNPVYVMLELYRYPILKGEWPPAWMTIYAAAVALLVFAIGMAVFVRLRQYFDSRI